MSFLDRVGALLGTRKWRSQASTRWAEWHYSEIDLEIAARVTRCLSEQLGIGFDEISPDSRFHSDIELPDFQDVEVAMAIEEEFELQFSEAELIEIDCVADLISAVSRKVNSAHPR